MAAIARSMAAVRVITNEKCALSDTRGHHRAVAVRRLAPVPNLAAGADGAGGADCLGDDAPDTLPELARPARSRGPAITGAEPGVLILVASADSPLRRIC